MYYKFMVYLDSGDNHGDVYKIAVPAKDEQDARDYVYGNGEVIAVRDVSDEYPIRADRVFDALKDAGFKEKEIDFIVRTLTRTEVAR